MAVHQHGRGAVLAAEFVAVGGGWLRIVHRVDRHLIGVIHNAGDVLRLQPVLPPQQLGAVVRRVGVATAGVGLQGVGQQGAVVPAQRPRQRLRVVIRRHGAQQAPVSRQNVLRSGKAQRRQACRPQAAEGTVGGVQGLAHGAVLQKLPQAGRLRPRRANGVQQFLPVQPHQLARRHGRAERPHHSSGMPVVVGAWVDGLPHPCANLVARGNGSQHLTPGAVKLLPHRQRRGDGYRPQVGDRGVVHVVHIHDMGARGVQRGSMFAGEPLQSAVPGGRLLLSVPGGKVAAPDTPLRLN